MPDPIGPTADVMAGLDRLLERLCYRLSAAQAGARKLRLELKLLADIGRRIQQEPVMAVGADRGRRLGARMRSAGVAPGRGTRRTPAVPLREATAGRRTKENHLHQTKRGPPKRAPNPPSPVYRVAA